MDKEGVSKNIRSAIGWLLIAGAIERIPALALAAISRGFELPIPGQEIWKIASAAFLLAMAGVQLVRLRTDGVWWGYLALLFTGWFEAGPLTNYIAKVVYLGPLSAVVNAALGVVILGFLAWGHLLATSTLLLPRIKGAAGATLLAGVVVFGLKLVGLKDFEWGGGQAASVAEVPHLLEWSKEFKSAGPVHYHFERVLSLELSSVLVAGHSGLAEVEAFAAKHGLKKMDLTRRNSWPTFAKSWKLNRDLFPHEFTPEDHCFSGRIPKEKRASVTIYFREKDNTFLVQSLRNDRKTSDRATPDPGLVKSSETNSALRGQTK